MHSFSNNNNNNNNYYYYYYYYYYLSPALRVRTLRMRSIIFMDCIEHGVRHW